jgi:LPS-assembly protein
MTLRTKTCITLLFLCQQLVATGMFTSRLQAQQPGRAEGPPPPPAQLLTNDESGEPVTIKARQQEKQGDIYTLSGDVEIEFRDYTVRADEVMYDAASGAVHAKGHLAFDGGVHDEHIEASRGEYNVRTQTGKFYDVVGTTGVRFRGRNVTLTTDEPFAFTGKLVEKVSKDQFVVHEGSVTSCELPKPKWTFNAQRVEIHLGSTARIYNSTFRIRSFPIFYFPFAAHPVTKLGRQSGFLVPTFGASSRKGTIIGESFYWAINRSMDATVGAEYYSSRGWAQHGEFRAKPTPNSTINATYFGVLDRGFGPAKIDQGGQDVKLSAEAILPANIRGVVSANYLSSFLFRLAFTETFAQAVNSEVKSLAFVSKDLSGYFLNVNAARYQNFQSSTKGDLITIVHVPSFELNTVEHRIFKSPFYWSGTGAIEGVSRREPTFKTDDVVGRIDLNPRLSLPVFLRGWTLRSEVGFRNTFYTQRRSDAAGIGTPLDEALNRRAIEASAELRPPTLMRIFAKPVFGRTLKHTIEPKIAYHVVNGVSGFRNVIRFDWRDIQSDTSEIEYGITQRWFLKKNQPCPPEPAAQKCEGPHEFISWEIVNRYYFDPEFGGAVVNGKRNVLTSTADFTGIAFLTEPRRFSPVLSRLRVRATANTDVSWQLDYDTKKGRINASTVFVNYRLGDFFVGGSHAFLHAPGEIFVNNPIPAPDKFNQFRVLLGYGSPTKRGWSASTNIGFDSNTDFLQYGSFQGSYNWDCCGLSMEYRRFALGTVRNENQFRFAFTLANIGTFGNLKRQDRIF